MDDEFAIEKRNDPRSTAELIHLALTEPDEDAAWEPVGILQYRATREVLDSAQHLCASGTAKERELGANILGQLGIPERAFPEECFQILRKMLAPEDDPGTLNAIAVAFGHLDDPRCIDLLIPLKAHPDSNVRFGLVHGISGHNHPAAIQTLIELSSDEDDEVRNWATFGLGILTFAKSPDIIFVDSPAIRDALAARLSDAFAEARMEALVGLARRKDQRAFDPLLEELTEDDVDEMAIEAAEELGDPRLLSALQELKHRWPESRSREEEWLDKAIASCTG